MKQFIRMFALVTIVGVLGSTTSAQTQATARLMRQKLSYAQRILEAIVTSNYALLELNSTELSRLPSAAAWDVLRTPEYQRYSAAFLKASGGLTMAAKQRDLDAASKEYATLTITCYECHRYMKSARIVR